MYEISEEIEKIKEIKEEINNLITHLINNKINTILNNYNNDNIELIYDLIEYIILLRLKYLLYKL